MGFVAQSVPRAGSCWVQPGCEVQDCVHAGLCVHHCMRAGLCACTALCVHCYVCAPRSPAHAWGHRGPMHPRTLCRFAGGRWPGQSPGAVGPTCGAGPAPPSPTPRGPEALWLLPVTLPFAKSPQSRGLGHLCHRGWARALLPVPVRSPRGMNRRLLPLARPRGGSSFTPHQKPSPLPHTGAARWQQRTWRPQAGTWCCRRRWELTLVLAPRSRREELSGSHRSSCSACKREAEAPVPV